MAAWTIRRATRADAAACADIYNHWVTTSTVTFDLQPVQASALAATIDRALQRHTFCTAVQDARVLGFAYAGSFKDKAAYAWACETTIYLQAGERGRTIGRELYRTVLDTLADQGFRVVTGCLALPNQASVALHEALGFTQVALFPKIAYKFGQWQDMGWWQREIGAGTASPPAGLAPITRLPSCGGS